MMTPTRPIAALAGAALFACITPVASGQGACDTKVFFFSEYGDNTRVYDNTTGSVDRFDSYTSPPCFMTYLQAFSRPLHDTDNTASPTDVFYPWVLDGYSAFDPDNVSYAVLRLDVFYQHRGTFGNDALSTYNDLACAASGGYQFAPDLQNHLIDWDLDVDQWVAIHMDLKSGRVYAHGIDEFGVPIPGRDYGDIGALGAGVGALILQSASDGDLYGIVQDDLRIGYVSLIGLSTVPSTDRAWCPQSVNLRVGQYQYGNAASLCIDDGNYLSYQSAGGGATGQSPLAKIVEYEVTFVGINPGLNYCEFCFTLRGNNGLRPDTVEIWIFNHAVGDFQMIDSAYFPNSREGGDGYRQTCLGAFGPGSPFISPSGNVVVKLKEARWRWPGVYHVAVDELTLKTRTVP
jgi:hypothetical protein